MRVSLLFCHGTGLWPRAIQIAQRLRFGRDFSCRFNHVAVLIEEDTRWSTVIEAKATGVRMSEYRTWAKDAPEHRIVHLSGSSLDLHEMALFAHTCVGQRYDWLTIVTIALHLVTGGKVSFSLDGYEICSGLVARMLERRGDYFDSPATVMPAELFQHISMVHA